VRGRDHGSFSLFGLPHLQASTQTANPGVLPFKSDIHRQLLITCLAKAGLPE
jgi:hypothetical protein